MAKIKMLNFTKNDIIHTNDILKEISEILKGYHEEKILIITDINTEKYCLSHISEAIDNEMFKFTLKTGEGVKNTGNLIKIWNFLTINNFSKKSLIINLGGGVVTDIGGFAASTFKRGIDFINIPTTLLAQVDASIGGKNGINFLHYKNNIGTITIPKKVIITPVFLETLKRREFFSGFAEMIKHALINSKNHYDELIFYYKSQYPDFSLLLPLIKKSIEIKREFTDKDLNDNGIRKILNFGHTFGHAFESLGNKTKKNQLKHGEAVVFGMICELFLSVKLMNFPESLFKIILKDLILCYGTFKISETDFNQIFELMQQDKKNSRNSILCVLLKDVGIAQHDVFIDKKDVFDSLDFLNSIDIEKWY